jgi:molybdate transport system ATP-binding protein
VRGGNGLRAAVRVAAGDLVLDVDVEVAPGHVVAVLGPNGAGKTTLLRALAGLVPLAAGAVSHDGSVWEDTAAGVRLRPEQRPVGVVFQDGRLFPHLSAADNVAFGLRARGVPRREARRRAGEWLDRVGMAGRGDARPGALSGGQAQRVALARALAVEPRVLLLDEPLAALDATSRVEVRRELRRHLASFRGVRLLVTHDPVEAVSLADRVVVLEEGRVVQEGLPADLAARPRSAFVADLAGVNLYRGRASGGGIVLAGGFELRAPAAASASGAVLAVIHPRAVSLHPARPEGTPRNVWAGTVESVDPEGERARVRVDGPLPVVAEVTPAAVAELGLAPGTPVWAAVKAAEVGVYPA